MPGPLGTGERKLATLMFADITGYTDMTRRLDPEDVVSAVDPVMRDLQRIAEAHGGTVLMTAGDGVLCAFGVPHVREDDALRAVRAAAQMRTVADSAAGTSGVHIGIASGEILISPDDSARGWGITGLCVALASRLSDLATNGEILADEACRRLAGPAARWGPERASQIQGMGEQSILVAQLLDLDGATSPRIRTPLVDRQVEQARLDELLAQVQTEGRSSVVSLQGEAGIGKSRLLEGWLDRHPEVTPIIGRCHSYGDARPLAGLLDAVLEHLRVLGLLDPRSLSRLLNPGASPEDDALVNRVLALADGELPQPVEDMAEVLGQALRALLVALSEHSPVGLVIDDTHWAGEDLIAFLGALDERPLEGQLLVVALQREGRGWGDLPALEPLPEWASKQLIARRVVASEDLVLALLARTGGNPLYLEESLNLLEDGVAVEDLATQVPASVRALLAARLDALPADAKEVALVASAGADLARMDALARLTGAAPDEALQTLVARGILVEVVPGGFRFGHRLFQEVAYSVLTRSRRVRLHLAYLDLIGAESPSLRAFHAEAAWQHLNADSPDRAEVARLALTELKALGELVFTWQASGARAAFERAERIAVDLIEDNTGIVALVLAAHAQVLVDLGQLPEALSTARRAVAAADLVQEPRAEALSRLALGHALARIGDMAEARDELETVQVLAGLVGERGLRGRALKVLAETWRFESESRFCALLEDAFAELRAAGDQAGQAEVARLLAYLLSMTGGARFRQWYDAASGSLSLDDLRGRALMARVACFVVCARADWGAARDLADDALALGRRAGVRDVVVDATLAGIEARTFLGDIAGALALREQLISDELPPRGRLALACAGVLALLRAGDDPGAVKELAVAASLASQFGSVERLLERNAFAEALLDAGRWHEAERFATEAKAAAGAADLTLLELQVSLLICRIRLALGRPAGDELRAALADAELLDARPLALLAEVMMDIDASRPPTTGLPDKPYVEARALWFEATAMAGDPDAWQLAEQEWARLGRTVWTERAALARQALPRTTRELAELRVTPLLGDLTAAAADA